MIIRDETPDDQLAIFNITRDAFAEKSFSSGTEPYIIDGLRDAGVLTTSLVAEIDGQVVGHIAFSPVIIGDNSQGWYGLGPIAVRPELQHQGIGKALIEAGLARLRTLNANGCVLIGDPNYYSRSGFYSVPNLSYQDVPTKLVQIFLLAGDEPTGEVKFHGAFDVTIEQIRRQEMNADLLDKQFEFNVWANVQLMETCAKLTETQLATTLAGTAGSIKEILAHIVYGEGRYLYYLTGTEPWTVEPDWDSLLLDEVAELAQMTGDRLLAVASKVDPMKQHERMREDKPYVFFNHTIVAQAIYHAIEHRTQVKLMLTQLGVEHPELSSWDYTGTLAGE